LRNFIKERTPSFDKDCHRIVSYGYRQVRRPCVICIKMDDRVIRSKRS